MSRFSMEQALLILEREAKYKSENPARRPVHFPVRVSVAKPAGLHPGTGAAMSADPLYTEDWRDYILMLQTRLGDVDFAKPHPSYYAHFVKERRKTNPEFEPKYPTLFGEREGKIARANRGRDPVICWHWTASLAIPRSRDSAAPTSSKPAFSCSSRRSPSSRTASRPAESELNQDVDLSQVIVKPEDTAGVPSGWGKRAGDSGQ